MNVTEVQLLRMLLREWADTFPAFRNNPMGAPGSDARRQQELHIELEDDTRAVLRGEPVKRRR